MVALVMLAAIIAAGFLLPRSQHLASLMVIVPATTAALAGARMTALIAVLSCLSALALDAHDGLLDTSIFAVHLLAVILVSGFVIAFRRVRERNITELTEVRAVSETVQRVLLRPLPERVGAVRIKAVYHASHPYAMVGGDLYAAARSAGGVRIVIGDVKGKGLPAVDDAAALLGAFRSAPHGALTLPQLVAELESSMRTHFEGPGASGGGDPSERFITMLVLEIPDGEGHISMVNCGHPPPYLILPDETALVPSERPSPPVGLGSVRAEDYPIDTFPLGRRATILLYTDGAIEARDAGGTFYDLGARVAAWTERDRGDLLQYVLEGLTEHVGGEMRLDDDVAMVALTCERADERGGAGR
ncbi:PP2C family protein-serine/threonine phosphatase [Streptomyces fuscigenes]|uniref:PP2C family protein-serine/threonine phosphatase n=1 Tax=Streptomyces fuscigenes TaxID=1528880 RepID=UPI001F1E4133|nr:PP2C family protein-serine/threonine phosphatase [Streptomyces fuscigenes]MCF3961630.1 serine/threonine-protein phosphatase [Streptomyces fuscigenes]